MYTLGCFWFNSERIFKKKIPWTIWESIEELNIVHPKSFMAMNIIEKIVVKNRTVSFYKKIVASLYDPWSFHILTIHTFSYCYRIGRYKPPYAGITSFPLDAGQCFYSLPIHFNLGLLMSPYFKRLTFHGSSGNLRMCRNCCPQLSVGHFRKQSSLYLLNLMQKMLLLLRSTTVSV